MRLEKKIFLNKNDGLETAVDRLIETAAHIVVLNIPRDSVLGESVDNFHILKRESLTAEKELIVESVDERILELAALANLKAWNPIFKKRERVIADILPRPRFTAEELSGKVKEEETAPEKVEKIKMIPPAPERKIFKKPKRQRVLKKVFVSALFLAVALGGFFFANRVLPRATVEMILAKTSVPFRYEVEVNKAVQIPEVKEGKVLVPGELLVAKRNLTLSFPASGEKKVERKAKGVLTVYNAYSSLPQPLVATTRFLSPDGKLFRLDERVTIPGAKVEAGKIIPSKIDVRVTADEPGEEYNIGPTKNWRIPGFRGTPRYEGFYAESSGPMTGGFVGFEAVPTEEDIRKGKEKLIAALETALENELLILLSDRFKVFPTARRFEVLSEEVLPAREKSFEIFAEAELRYLVFEEAMVKEALVAAAQRTLPADLRVRKFSLNWGEPAIDLNKGVIGVSLEGEIVFEPAVNVEKLKVELSGQDEEELRKTVSLLRGLERANISLWPFWVNKVPARPEKIEIILK